MKSGFVAILGRPNVGKSTLLNAVVGDKVAIVSPKPQTTRDAIRGILTRAEGQIVFVDSPGIHIPQQELGRRMMREVDNAADGCQAAVLLVDATKRIGPGDEAAIERVKRLGVPALLGLNKIDALPRKDALLPLIEAYRTRHEFAEIIPLSARRRENVDVIIEALFKLMPEAPAFYSEDLVTDQPQRFLAGELIRERVLFETEQEVPHSTAVVIERWEEEPGMLRLWAVIYVERAGQKGIIIGNKGAMLKQIGESARRSLESRFDTKVHLEVFVKVTPKWRDKPAFLAELSGAGFLNSD